MANPIKTSNNKVTNCTPVSSECVIWEGPDLPCIELCHGDTISDVQYKIADFICNIKTSLNLTDLDIACIPLAEAQENGVTTLKKVLTALISRYCDLEDRVTTLEDAPAPTNTGGDSTLSIKRISCIQDITGDDIGTNPTNNAIVQLIVDGLCKTWSELESEVTRLQTLINNIPTSSGGSVTIPNVTSSCLWSSSDGSKSITEAWSILDADWCDYRSVLGSTVGLSGDGITEGTQCYTNINTFLLTTGDPDDLISSDGTLITSHNNLWKTMCALVTKVQAMNDLLNTCCGFSCKKFEVGVNAINFDVGTNEIDLRFTFNGSISLPTSAYEFADLGSIVTFTDVDGVPISYTIDITDNSTYENLDITGLNLNGDIQVDVDLNFSVLDLSTQLTYECAKCLHTSFKTNIECAFCTLRVSVTGDNPIVEIYYTVNGNDNKITVTKEGSDMEYIIPALAVITQIVNINNSAVTIVSTSCPKLVIPEIETLACYAFIISGNSYYYSSTDAYTHEITGFYINGVHYDYSSPIRADLTNARDHFTSYTDGITETTGGGLPDGCFFSQIDSTDDVEYFNSLVKLQAIPSNPYVFSVQKLCSFVTSSPTPGTLLSQIIIVKAISGKDIFLKLNKSTALNITLDSNPDSFIKGTEITQGLECDCCAVYDGS